MAVSKEYIDYILGQLETSGSITHRAMFGGVGIYVEGVFCAIIGSSGRFYLRVGPSNLRDFEDQGMQPFSGRKGAGMPYYEVPEDVVEDREQLRQWAHKARAAAVAAKAR